jgi:hypothetical protein
MHLPTPRVGGYLSFAEQCEQLAASALLSLEKSEYLARAATFRRLAARWPGQPKDFGNTERGSTVTMQSSVRNQARKKTAIKRKLIPLR